MEKKVFDKGSTIEVRLANGPVVTVAKEELTSAYGDSAGPETLAGIARVTEDCIGYPYMTPSEREAEFWKVFKGGQLDRLVTVYEEKCESLDAYDAFDDYPCSSHEVDPECQELEAKIEALKAELGVE